jgi:hypothetical protein
MMKAGADEIVLVPASEVQVGDYLDLEDDKYAAFHADQYHTAYDRDYQQVESILIAHEHSGQTIFLSFEFGDVGFPPDWKLRVWKHGRKR